MKSCLIFFCSLIIHPITARGETVLFEYEGREWSYRDFAEYRDVEFFDSFKVRSLDDLPVEDVKDTLIFTEPTGPGGRALNAKYGAEIIDSYEQNFVANFLVSESISEFVRRRNLDERFPEVFESFEKAVSLRATTIVQYFEAFDESLRDDGDYEAFVERFKDVFALSDAYPTEEYWKIYQSEGGETYRIRSKLLPYTDMDGNPSRWLIDMGKSSLLLALIRELVREDYEELLNLFAEESSTYKVLLVRYSEVEETDLSGSKRLLGDLTREFEGGEIEPSVFLELPGVSVAVWETISGEEVKRIAEPYDFFRGISGLGSRWIKVPEQNAFIYLVDEEPVTLGQNLIEKGAIYADARSLMWKRILESSIYEIFDSMDIKIEIPDVSLERLLSTLGPGGVLENVFGVPTGWKKEFIGYDVSLEEFVR